MILGFKPQFVDLIYKGTKIHSIREDKANRWHIGRQIHLATGVRTKDYKQFSDKICTGIQLIEINYMQLPVIVKVDNRKLSRFSVTLLARQDGFDTVDDFFKFFEPYGFFQGRIIHWTNKRY